MKCTKCGTVNSDNMKFCKYCGEELLGENLYQTKNKSVFNRIIIVLIIVTVISIVGLVGVIIFSNSNASKNSGNNSKYIAETTLEDTTTFSTLEAIEESTVPITTVKLIKVPDIVGLKSEDAAKELDNFGLKYTMLLQESNTVDIDYVISQFPSADKEVKEGETVTVYVSKSSLHKQQSSQLSDNSADVNNTMYCCASDYATLRDVPSRSGKSLAKIKTRGSVTWVGTTGEFYCVKYNGKLGYVLKDFFSYDYDAPLNYGSGNIN